MFEWMQRRTTIDEELLMAHFELLQNPSITTYEMIDGVETRHAAPSFARVTDAFVRLGEAAIIVQAEFRGFADNVKAAFEKMQVQNYERLRANYKGFGLDLSSLDRHLDGR